MRQVRQGSKIKVMNKYEGYMATKEALTFLGISHQTLYEWIKAGKIQPVTFVGNKNYYKVEDLERLKSYLQSPKTKNFQAAEYKLSA